MKRVHIITDPLFKMKLDKIKADIEYKENRKITYPELTKNLDFVVNPPLLREFKKGRKYENIPF